MLQPGMCSAIVSVSSTWIGPPGALRDAVGDRRVRRAAAMFGPPTADVVASSRTSRAR